MITSPTRAKLEKVVVIKWIKKIMPTTSHNHRANRKIAKPVVTATRESKRKKKPRTNVVQLRFAQWKID